MIENKIYLRRTQREESYLKGNFLVTKGSDREIKKFPGREQKTLHSPE